MHSVDSAGLRYRSRARARSFTRPRLARAAVALNLAITLPLAALLNLWQDEAYTLHTTGRDLSYAFAQAMGFEQNAPLYFLIITAWRHINDSLFFTRLFSVLCIAGALWLLPAVVSRYLRGVPAGWVCLAAALNPFTIYAAVDARVYAMIVLISTLLLLTFYDAFLDPRQSKDLLPLAAWSALVAVALYTQYYIAFLIAAQGVVLVFFKRSSLLRYCIGAACALAAFLPLARLIPGQVANFEGSFTPRSLPATLFTCARILVGYVFPLRELGHSHITYPLVAIALLAIAIAGRRHFTGHGNGMIILMTATAAAMLGAALYTEHVIVFVRHMAALFIPAVLSLFAIFTYVRKPFEARAVVTASVCCVVVSVLVLFSTYRALANPGDWIRVAAYLQAHERPGEPIAVFEAENALPLAYYYHGSNEIVPVPKGVSFTQYDSRDFVVKSEAQMHRAIPHAQLIWFVRAGDCRSATLLFGCDVVAHYLDAHYHVVSTMNFYKSSVQLLKTYEGPR